jgi:tetratricopeptide (TPR) repeat protein
LNVALTDVENARSKRERPANPDAFDLILRARSLANHPMGPQEHAERITLLEQALRLDPSSIVAMTQLADEIAMGPKSELERAAKLIAAAAEIGPDDPHVLEATAFLLMFEERYSEAISAYQRLLDEHPNAHFAYYLMGICLTFTGKADEAIPMIERAIRRDPRNAYNYDRYGAMGFALLLVGRDQESIVWTQRALAACPAGLVAIRARYSVRLAAAYARLGLIEEGHRAIAETNRLWPYDTVRSHFPDDPSSGEYIQQIERYQASLRIAGLRDHAEEGADFGVPADGNLYQDYAGLTPTTAPGATTIRTTDLEQMLGERKPLVIDPLLYSWGRSIPGAVGLKKVGRGGSTSDAIQDRLRQKMQALTKGDLAAPIVAIGWNSERFDGRNLALRLVALGYTNVYWYRGGREAWEVNGLPETKIDAQDW